MIKFLLFSISVFSVELDISNCISCRTAFRDEAIQQILENAEFPEFYCAPNCANPLLVEGMEFYVFIKIEKFRSIIEILIKHRNIRENIFFLESSSQKL